MAAAPLPRPTTGSLFYSLHDSPLPDSHSPVVVWSKTGDDGKEVPPHPALGGVSWLSDPHKLDIHQGIQQIDLIVNASSCVKQSQYAPNSIKEDLSERKQSNETLIFIQNNDNREQRTKFR